LVSPATTPYYHCISRCVRRALLCGEDPVTGRDYAHRKAWVVERLATLVEVFAIDLVAYAVMANHYHLVLRIDASSAEAWSEAEVMERWGTVFKVPESVLRYARGEVTTRAEQQAAQALIAHWRDRLMDLSWFMRALNEHLARRANAEDECTGRFWEGRFTSQALLDEAAVLACMAYVDLNPVRAGVAETPEAADYTSIQQRAQDTEAGEPEAGAPPIRPALMPLVASPEAAEPDSLGLSRADYLELVDWTGRAVRADKPGAIPAAAPPILARLGLDPSGFVRHAAGRSGPRPPVVLGSIARIRQAAEAAGRRFFKGLGLAQRLYAAAA
jgi:REP element-mobilizing transposase RayT